MATRNYHDIGEVEYLDSIVVCGAAYGGDRKLLILFIIVYIDIAMPLISLPLMLNMVLYCTVRYMVWAYKVW